MKQDLNVIKKEYISRVKDALQQNQNVTDISIKALLFNVCNKGVC